MSRYRKAKNDFITSFGYLKPLGNFPVIYKIELVFDLIDQINISNRGKYKLVSKFGLVVERYPEKSFLKKILNRNPKPSKVYPIDDAISELRAIIRNEKIKNVIE